MLGGVSGLRGFRARPGLCGGRFGLLKKIGSKSFGVVPGISSGAYAPSLLAGTSGC